MLTFDCTSPFIDLSKVRGLDGFMFLSLFQITDGMDFGALLLHVSKQTQIPNDALRLRRERMVLDHDPTTCKFKCYLLLLVVSFALKSLLICQS